MDAYNDPLVKEIWIKKSAQVGYTEILNNIVGFVIDANPGPMLMAQPTLSMAQTWSKDRLAPMLRDTPTLRGKVAEVKSKSSSNTILHKNYSGGHLTIVGANSPTDLASRPIRDALCDEIDRYPLSAGPEGDPIKLIGKRLVTFWNATLLCGSTPTIKGISRVEHGYERTDKRMYFVPCPHCNEKQVLKWQQLHYDKEKPEKAAYVCEFCGVLIEHKHKRHMITHGEWRATAPFKGRAGFFINALYSPWESWAAVVDAWLDAEGKPELEQTFINTYLGEAYEVKGIQLESEVLYKRREPYDAGNLPDDILFVTCAGDVQGDRIELEVKGWGFGYENWGIEQYIVYGDPEKSEVWEKVESFLKKEYLTRSRFVLPISRVFIDSKFLTDYVLQFCARQQNRARVFPVHGVSGWGKPVVERPTRKNKYFVRRYPMAADVAKQHIQRWLQKTDLGPRYCHFPHTYDREYFDQLTAEKLEEKTVKGYTVLQWVKTRGRNEATDLFNMNYAAMLSAKPNFDLLAKKREKRAKTEEKPNILKNTAQQRVRNRRRLGG